MSAVIVPVGVKSNSPPFFCQSRPKGISDHTDTDFLMLDMKLRGTAHGTAAARQAGGPCRKNRKQAMRLAHGTPGTAKMKIFFCAGDPPHRDRAGTKNFSKLPFQPFRGDFPMPVIGLGGTDAARTARQPPRPRPHRRTSLSPPEWPAMAAPGPALAPLKAPPGGAPPPRQGHPG